MEQRIKDRYHDDILQQAMRRYGIAPERIRPLDAFESYIYAFERADGEYILRISHSLRRSETLIRGEVDWINHLAAGGVSVARAVHSQGGNLVEVVEDGRGGAFLATAFVKAAGRRPWEAGWTHERYETLGRLLGSMHALAVEYRPPEPAWKRPEWDDSIMEYVERYLPASESAAKHKYRALCEHLHRLPKEKASYGLIHQDAHENNYFMDEAGRITLFDFDDCAYSWFANDVAIALFYMVQEAKDWPAFTRELMTPLLRGYGQTHPFDPAWLQELPVFLKLRELELYAVLHRDFDLDNIDNEWCARFMQDRKSRIEHDIPFIDFDFQSLAVHL
jgi:amicoumacin kinase